MNTEAEGQADVRAPETAQSLGTFAHPKKLRATLSEKEAADAAPASADVGGGGPSYSAAAGSGAAAIAPRAASAMTRRQCGSTKRASAARGKAPADCDSSQRSSSPVRSTSGAP